MHLASKVVVRSPEFKRDLEAIDLPEVERVIRGIEWSLQHGLSIENFTVIYDRGGRTLRLMRTAISNVAPSLVIVLEENQAKTRIVLQRVRLAVSGTDA